MKLSDLVFTGFNKRVAAVHRESGELVWQWKAPRMAGYITLLLDADRLVVSINGYLYALDALTGRELWSNDLPGFGTGIASLASVNGNATSNSASAQQTQAAAAAAAAASST